MAISPSKLLVLRAKNSYVALKLKKMTYVSFSGEVKAIYYVNLYIKLLTRVLEKT